MSSAVAFELQLCYHIIMEKAKQQSARLPGQLNAVAIINQTNRAIL